MTFQEPKAEFVSVDLTINAQEDQSQAGYETCTGPLAPSNTCPGRNEMWLDGNGNEYYPE